MCLGGGGGGVNTEVKNHGTCHWNNQTRSKLDLKSSSIVVRVDPKINLETQAEGERIKLFVDKHIKKETHKILEIQNKPHLLTHVLSRSLTN